MEVLNKVDEKKKGGKVAKSNIKNLIKGAYSRK